MTRNSNGTQHSYSESIFLIKVQRGGEVCKAGNVVVVYDALVPKF